MHLHPDFVCFLKCLRPGKPLPQVRRAKKEREARGEKAIGRIGGRKRMRRWKLQTFYFGGTNGEGWFAGVPGFHRSFELIELYVKFHVIYIYIYIVWFLCIVSGVLLVFYVMFLYFPCFPILILIHTWYIFTVHIQMSYVLMLLFQSSTSPRPHEFFGPPPQKVTLPPTIMEVENWSLQY